MSKLTKILAGVTLAASFGAWSGSHAYADLQYVVTQTTAYTDLNSNGNLWADFTLTVKDTTPGVTSAVFFDGIGGLSATGFTNNPFWSFNSFTLASPFTKTTGSIIPPNQFNPGSETTSSNFQNPSSIPPFTLNTQQIQFHAPGGGSGAGVAIPAEGLLLGSFNLYYNNVSAEPTIAWVPNSYSNSLVSHVWTEDSVGKTDKNGGVVTSIFVPYVPVVTGLLVVNDEVRNIDKTELDTFATSSITVEPTGQLILTADLVSPRQSAAIVNEIDGAQLLVDGTIDITNRDLIIHNTTLDAVQALVLAGKIITSNAGTAVGYSTAGDLGISSFDTISVVTGDVLIKNTYNGDLNLDGNVDITDAALLSTHWQQSVTTDNWHFGDLNGDNVVDISDAALLSTNWQATPQLAGNPSAVPEPASLTLLAVGALALVRRRKA